VSHIRGDRCPFNIPIITPKNARSRQVQKICWDLSPLARFNVDHTVSSKNMVTILKNERVRRGLTQKEFGRLVNIPQPYVCDYENGNVPIGLRRAAQISRVIGLHRSEFVDADGFAIELTGARGDE
jgi:hypothetical protein